MTGTEAFFAIVGIALAICIISEIFAWVQRNSR